MAMVTVGASDQSGANAKEAVLLPVCASEQQYWTPTHAGLFSRAEVRRQTGPYQSAVPTQIAARQFSVAAGLAADVEEAALALRDFDRHAMTQLGTKDPALGPMSAILLRTESASSSQIEQLSTTAKQLALVEINEGDKKNAVTVVGNVRAMEAALRLSADLSAEAILVMHAELMSKQVGMEQKAGKFRTEQVWVGGDNAGPIGAAFIAPHHSRVPDAIADVVDFMRRDDLSALIQVAIAHAQFETIHPFTDGNGRTGRAIAHALLRSKGLVSQTTAPISAGLLVNTESYFAALTDYRNGDAGPIIRRFADASRYAAVTGINLVDALQEQLAASEDKLNGLRRQARAWDVLPLFIGQPVVNSRYVQQKLGVSAMTAIRALDALTEHGVIVEKTGKSRNRVWQHDGVISALNEYAASIHRRA